MASRECPTSLVLWWDLPSGGWIHIYNFTGAVVRPALWWMNTHIQLHWCCGETCPLVDEYTYTTSLVLWWDLPSGGWIHLYNFTGAVVRPALWWMNTHIQLHWCCGETCPLVDEYTYTTSLVLWWDLPSGGWIHLYNFTGAVVRPALWWMNTHIQLHWCCGETCPLVDEYTYTTSLVLWWDLPSGGWIHIITKGGHVLRAATSPDRNRQILTFRFLGGPELPLQKTSQVQLSCVPWKYPYLCKRGVKSKYFRKTKTKKH